MSHIYQHVWPIIDGARSRRDLIVEALDELEAAVDAADAITIGPPLWLIYPAGAVLGWTAYPGNILIARVPVELPQACPDWFRPDVDQDRVELALAGRLTARELTTAERRHVVELLIGRGLDDRGIGTILRWSDTPLRARNAVTRFRHRHNIHRPAPAITTQEAAA